MSIKTDGKPIKRDQNIQPLSREHHFGLLLCWKIRTGIKYGIATERIIRYLNYFWTGHLNQHFKAEEELLFRKVNDPLCDRALQEHVQLKEMISSLVVHTSPDKYALLDKFAVILAEHIRFEERVLFPYLEKAMTAAQLAEVGSRLSELHEEEFEDNYPDEFWVKPK